MNRYSNIFSMVILSFFYLCFINMAYSNEMENRYMQAEPYKIESISWRENDYDSIGVLIDNNNYPMVFCSYSRIQKFYVFSSGNDYVSSLSVVPAFSIDGVISKNKKQQAYVIDNGFYWKNDFDGIRTISIYDFDPNNKVNAMPKNVFKIDDNVNKSLNKASAVKMQQILPLFDGNDIFVIGKYTESKLTPLTFIKRVVSFGEAGHVQKIFGMTIKNDKVNEWFSFPEKVESDTLLYNINSIACGYKIHITGIMSKEYSEKPYKVFYASFDQGQKKWSNMNILYKSLKRDASRSSKYHQTLSDPSIACSENNIYCSWSSDVVSDFQSYKMESGIYFCENDGGNWSTPEKISDFGVNPILLVNEKIVYVVWMQYGKGVYCKNRVNGNWSNAQLLFEDTNILWSAKGNTMEAAIDKNNDLHIVYIQKANKEQNLMYTKIKM